MALHFRKFPSFSGDFPEAKIRLKVGDFTQGDTKTATPLYGASLLIKPRVEKQRLRLDSTCLAYGCHLSFGSCPEVWDHF